MRKTTSLHGRRLFHSLPRAHRSLLLSSSSSSTAATVRASFTPPLTSSSTRLYYTKTPCLLHVEEMEKEEVDITNTTTTTTAAATTPSASEEEAAILSRPYCILCDAPLPSPLTLSGWDQHCEQSSHTARVAIATVFCRPDREKHINDSLVRHFNLDFGEVEESTARRVSRRRERLISSILKIKKDGLLAHSIPRWSEEKQKEGTEETKKDDKAVPSSIEEKELEVGERFGVYARAGHAYLQCELFRQASIMAPTIPSSSISAVIDYLTSPRVLSRMFDSLQYHQLLPPGGAALHSEAKASILLATIGEMSLFERQRGKPRRVADRSAASVLVQHILTSHSLDTVVAEILHTTLQRLVDEGNPVWPEAQEQIAVWARQRVRSEPSLSPSQDHRRALYVTPTPQPLHFTLPESVDPTTAKEHRVKLWRELRQLLATIEIIGEGSTAAHSKKEKTTPPLAVAVPHVKGNWTLAERQWSGKGEDDSVLCGKELIQGLGHVQRQGGGSPTAAV